MIAAGMAMLTGCNPDRGFVPVPDSIYADDVSSISGRVCDPSGRTWLTNAMAYTHIIVDGKLVDTRVAFSDRNGDWLLSDLPVERTYEVFVQHGSEILLQEEVYLPPGTDGVVFTEPPCFDPLELKVAVITGDYDDFELVLQQLGFANYVLYDGLRTGYPLSCADCADHLLAFLSDLAAMQQYDVIMFNGGMTEKGVLYTEELDEKDETIYPENALVMDNIRAFVQGGGAIYASDWAYDVIEIGWPEKIEYIGVDDIPDAAQTGDQQAVNAAISDAQLSAWLGADHVEIEYDLPVWPAIMSTEKTVSTHLSGQVSVRIGSYEDTLTAVPLLASFSDGKGKVVNATFRVAKNGSTEMLLIMQYMLYSL
jgi:hypothetical protein